jgi:hypothetical protein
MRNLAILVGLLLITTVGLAADKEPEKSTKETEVQKSADQKPAAKKPTPAWPRPYKPTEEISADSNVSFPTDI